VNCLANILYIAKILRTSVHATVADASGLLNPRERNTHKYVTCALFQIILRAFHYFARFFFNEADSSATPVIKAQFLAEINMCV